MTIPKRIFAVSFPRSGSSLIRDSLRDILGDRLRWCDGQVEIARNRTEDKPDPALAESTAEFNYIKYHDFELAANPPEDCWLVVQYREPVSAIVSWFDMDTAAGKIPDTAASWAEFSSAKADYWIAWKRRWVEECCEQRLTITLEHLAIQPEQHLFLLCCMLGIADLNIPKPALRTISHPLWFRYDLGPLSGRLYGHRIEDINETT